MENYDLGSRGVAKNSRHIYSVGEKYTFGKVKNLSDRCRSEKQEHESDNEINSSEATKLLATERQCLNCEHPSSSECTKENACDHGSLSSVISTSTSLTQKKESCGGESCGVISCCSGLAGDGNKDGEVPQHSTHGVDSRLNISMKSDVSSETRQLQKENDELVTGTDRYYPIVGEDGKQPKTESSSSNSTHVILPAFSNDSCQEASMDGKSCKYGKTSDMVTSTSADLKCSLEDHAVKCSVLDRASGIIENVRATDCDKVHGIIADGNSMTGENTDLLRSNLSKKKNAELPDQGNTDSCYEVDDALEVARRVAKEMEREVGLYKEASGCSSTVEEKNSKTVDLSSFESVYPTRKDCLTECRVQSCNEQVKCVKEEGDPKMSMKGEQLCLEVDEPSENIGPKEMHESSYLTTRPEDVSCNGQTTDISSIDLNEDFLGNETEYPMQSVKGMKSYRSEHVSKPIPVVAKSGISICFPLWQSEGKPGGWRGSATTSAFQPTSFFKRCNGNKALFSSDDVASSKHSHIKGIDLNIAAAGVDFDVGSLPDKSVAAPSSLPCEESTRVGRFDFDLNCASDNNEYCSLSSPPASPSKHYARDFDLNDNLVSTDPCNDAHQPGQGTQPLRNRASDDPARFFLGNARQPDPNRVCPVYLPDLSSVHSFSHGHAKPYPVAAPSMLPLAEQMQRVVSVHHNMTYTPPPLPSHAFHYNHGLLFHPNSHPSSTIYAPGVLPYITDPREVNLVPQIVGSPAIPAFPGPPHLMEAPDGQGSGDMAIIRPNFDLNSGVNSSENGSRGLSTRQQYIPLSNSLMEEQMRSFQHSALSATPFKRREPEGGWDSHQLVHRQVNPWR